MNTEHIGFDFGTTKKATTDFSCFPKIFTDRKSLYAVSGGRVKNREAIQQFLQKLRREKNFHKASHHSWAARILRDGMVFEIKNDDGEVGAGATLLRVLQKENVGDTIVVVSRWFGGIHLYADRFRNIQRAAQFFCDRLSFL